MPTMNQRPMMMCDKESNAHQGFEGKVVGFECLKTLN